VVVMGPGVANVGMTNFFLFVSRVILVVGGSASP